MTDPLTLPPETGRAEYESGNLRQDGKLRDECLNEEVFYNARYAQVVIEKWRRQYNEERPHSLLGYRTPAEVARDCVVVAGALSEDGPRLTS